MRKGLNINCIHFKGPSSCPRKPKRLGFLMAKCHLANDLTKTCAIQEKYPRPSHPPPPPPPKRVISEDVGWKYIKRRKG